MYILALIIVVRDGGSNVLALLVESRVTVIFIQFQVSATKELKINLWTSQVQQTMKNLLLLPWKIIIFSTSGIF